MRSNELILRIFLVMLNSIRRKAKEPVCRSCINTRASDDDKIVTGVRRSSMQILSALTSSADCEIVF